MRIPLFKSSPWMLPQGQAGAQDLDGDGLPDRWEEELLRRCRPYYRFSASEHYRPTAPLTQQFPFAKLVGPLGAVYLDPVQASALLTCQPPFGSTDLTVSHRRSVYKLALADDRRAGPDWTDVETQSPGLYGHVVPVAATPYIKIEYWQFFAYSGTDLPAGAADHEGDWCTVQLWFDPRTKSLAKTAHYHHGDGTPFYFDQALYHSENPLTRTVTVAGLSIPLTIDVRPDPATRFPACRMVQAQGVDLLEYYTRFAIHPHIDGPSALAKLAGEALRAFTLHAAQILIPGCTLSRATSETDLIVEARVRFFVDDRQDEHVVVYIERDAHEFWPTEAGSTLGANEHKGDGRSFVVGYPTQRPLNLGEVEAPLSEEARLIVRFNGRWGDWHRAPHNNPPPGPALHTEWGWPAGSPLRRAIPDDQFEK